MTGSREVALHRRCPSLPPARPLRPGPDGIVRVPRRFNYAPASAHAQAEATRRRPKPGKLAAHPRLRDQVQARLRKRHSPEQIAGRLPVEFPDDPELRVSHETIYRSLYLQGKGRSSAS